MNKKTSKKILSLLCVALVTIGVAAVATSCGTSAHVVSTKSSTNKLGGRSKANIELSKPTVRQIQALY